MVGEKSVRVEKRPAGLVSMVASSNITSTTAKITWMTNENSDSQVEYGRTKSYGQMSTLDPALGASHTVMLTGLRPRTRYHYRVKSRDAAGNLAVSGDYTFFTTR
jgi:phosphodiesterase/alkaline phosphatase D-like protein